MGTAQGPGLPGERPPSPSAVAYRSVLLAAGLVIAILVFRQLVTLLVGVLITVIIAIPVAALATRLERASVPRAIGALLGILALFGLFGGVLALVIPRLVEQARALIEALPQITDTVVDRLADITGLRPARVGRELQSFVQGLVDDPARLLGPVASVSLGILTFAAAILFVAVTAYYMALRPQPLVEALLRLFAPERRAWASGVLGRLRRSWIGWLQGVAVDMVVSGVLLYVGLSLADVQFALLFAVLSAVLVVVPYFGAIAGGIPPVLFALADSPGKALLVLGIYVLVQQVEGNVIVPLVMSQTVKLHPAAIAVGVLVVAQLVGLVGLFVSVPLISAAVILTDELWVKPRERRFRERGELENGEDDLTTAGGR